MSHANYTIRHCLQLNCPLVKQAPLMIKTRFIKKQKFGFDREKNHFV